MRRLVGLVLAGVLMVAVGCTSPEERALASTLYLEASSIRWDLLVAEEQLPAAMRGRDSNKVAGLLGDVESLEAKWREASKGASGRVAEAADLFSQGMSLRVREFRSAFDTALYYRGEFAADTLRHQEAAMDLEEQALKQLKALAK